MERIRALVQRFLHDEEGLELVEYALIAAVVVIAVIAAIVFMWETVRDKFFGVGHNVEAPSGASSAEGT